MNVSLETVLRCLDLIPIIRENQGIELKELARRTDISEKVIAKQLIPMLMLCGAPPYLPHDYVSVWLEDDRVYLGFADHFARPVTLLPIEVVALHMALTSVVYSADDDGDLEGRLERLKMKIEKALPPEQRVFLEQKERISVDDSGDRESPHKQAFAAAIQARRKVEIVYLSFGETSVKRRIIHPYGVVVKDGATYVPSFDETRGHVVSFRLDRMQSVRVLLNHGFEQDPAFSLDRAVKDGLFGMREGDAHQVVVELVGRTARWVSEAFDQKQWEWKSRDILELRLPTSRLQAAVRWALSLGVEAEVKAPPEARRIAAEEIRRLQASYEEIGR